MSDDVVIITSLDHHHPIAKFRGYAHSKCNLQAKKDFVPMFAYIFSQYDNHLFVTKLAKKVRMKVLCKTDQNYNRIDMGCIKALDMFRFFHPLSLDAKTKTLNESEFERLSNFKLERRKGILPYDRLDSVDELNNRELPPKGAFCSKTKLWFI